MFIEPQTQVPQTTIDAAGFLQRANEFLEVVKAFQKREFSAFWSGKNKDEINAILAAMDSASPGQSVTFFQSASALAQFILAQDPQGLGNADWYPPMEYEFDPTHMTVRVK